MITDTLQRRFKSVYVTVVTTFRIAIGWNRKKLVGVIILAKSDSVLVIRMTQMCINSLIALNTTALKVIVIESGNNTAYRNAEVITPNIPFAYNEFMCIGIDSLRSRYNPDFFLLMNNDVVVLPGAVDQMVSSGAASVCPIDPTGEEQSSICRPTTGYSVRYHVVGWALFIRADLITRFGSDGLFPHDIRFYWQDYYFADFLKHHGVDHYVLPKSKMIHLESASTTQDVSEQMENNGDYQVYLSKVKAL
jgi:hypothetical protein